nr:hypothetical protein [Tanacetum cinerariifolium]
MLVTIAQHKFLLFKLCQVFHNNILVVKIVEFFLKPTIVNPHNIFNAHNDLLSSQTMLMEQMSSLTSMCEMVCQIVQKKLEEKQTKEEQAAKAQNSKIPACCDDDDDYNSAITPNEPVDSLSMGDEHLDTIPEKESDEFIKSCVENLIPNPNFPEEIFSNPLFEEEIIPMKIDPHHFNAGFDLIKSMLNHDSFIIFSSSKIDSLLDEFAGELTLLKSIASGIDETDCYLEEDIRLIERLFDSFIEEIDLSFNPDDPMPPSIEDDNDDSERDILILEELLDNYSLSLLVNESFYFDIPSFSRPPAKPPDGNTKILNIKMMGDITKQKVPIPKLMITLVSNQEKSLDLLSHRGFENFQLSAKRSMMIHGKNIPILDEETHFIKRLLYDNSCPRPPEEFVYKNFDATFESFSPSPTPVEDSDSLMEEIDLSFTPDDPMPPGIEEDDYDSKIDILILEEFLSNNSLSLPENESFHFDIPSFTRPPTKPPDGNSGILNVNVMGDISEQKVPIARLMFTQSILVLNQEKSPDLLSHQGHEAFQPSSAECPMMIYGKNTPILDILLFHFYPLDQFKYGGIGSSLATLNKRFMGGTPCLSLV